MAIDATWLDCCGNPFLGTEKVLNRDDHDRQTLCRCQTCGAWWFERFYEYIYFDEARPDDQIRWFARLAEAEAAGLISESQPNISFLAGRPCFRLDERGAMRTTYPWP